MLNPKFIDWGSDLTFSEFVMYGNAYGMEVHGVGFRDGLNSELKGEQFTVTKLQSFEDFLIECFNRELGDKDEITR